MISTNERRPRRRRRPDTRERIADAALELFSERGFEAANMRELADRLDMTSAALYYHYTDKADILVQIVEPMLEDTERLVDQADVPDTRVRLEGILDLLLDHAAVFRLLTTDVSAGNHPAIAEQVRDHNLRLFRFLEGPKQGPDEAAIVRAVAAFGVLARPIAVLPHIDLTVHRALLLDAATAVYDGSTRGRSRPARTSKTPKPL
jgi:AcrR family transcriptional regulator